MTKTYKIVRCYHPSQYKFKEDVEGMGGLTEEEAQEHCGRDDTSVKGVYFDAYDEEDPDLEERAEDNARFARAFAGMAKLGL